MPKEQDNYRQETDTISRLVFGFASCYLLTGEDRFLEGAEKGTDYLRDHMRFYDADEKVIYWYHGIDVRGQRETKVFASEFGDDYDAIPAYEQIYALAGPIQTYRITGDPRILRDAEMTVDLFDRFYLDRHDGGYYSHLDPITLDAQSDALGPNKGKKNWNSVGDHAPAYLINLYLATGEKRYADFLEYTFDTIEKYFPNYDESPFVQEKFFTDWSADRTHMWQQNRGVVGHNLKIAWNLLRMQGLKPKDKYAALARKIGEVMPAVGMDRQRAGWYDVMERMRRGTEEWNRFAFHDRKAWWQQEQGILAYLILKGVLGDDEHLRIARESAGLLQRLLPGPRRRRRLLQRAGQRHPVPDGHGALQGQPLHELLPLVGAVLPGRGLQQPAHLQAADGFLLQAAAGRVQAQHPARVARHPARRHGPHRRSLDRRRAVRQLRRQRADGQAAGHQGAGAREGAHRPDLTSRRAWDQKPGFFKKPGFSAPLAPCFEHRGCPMQINVRTQDQVQIVEIVGEIDSNTAPDAQAALMGLMQPGAKIVLDMSQVAFMSSAGLRLLLLTYRTIKGNGGEVVLAGLSDDLKDTMEMTGFLDFFTHADNVDAALAALT